MCWEGGTSQLHGLGISCIHLVYLFVLLFICILFISFIIDLPASSEGKESTCNEGVLGLIPVSGRSPGAGYGNPLQYSYLENPHGQRSLVGYSPWGHRESDMAERLSTAHILSNKLVHVGVSLSSVSHYSKLLNLRRES